MTSVRIFSTILLLFFAKVIFAQYLNKLPFIDLNINEQLNNTYITAITQDDLRFLYIGTQAGLYFFDGHSIKRIDLYNDQQNYITALFFDDKHGAKLWIGTINGLVLLNKKRKRLKCILKKTKHTNWIYAIYQVYDDKIWVSTNDGKLFEIDANTLKTKLIKDTHVVQKNIIYDITRLSDNLWLSTQKGIISYDVPTRKSFLYRNSLIEQNKSSGNLLSLINKIYTSNKLILSISDPSLNQVFKPSSRTFISTISLNGVEIEMDTGINYINTLKIYAPVNPLIINPGNIDYNTYKYKLTGLETDFSYTTVHRISYQNLSIGQYTLYVQAINALGRTDFQPIMLGIQVFRPHKNLFLSRAMKTMALILTSIIIVILGLLYSFMRSQKLLKIIKNQKLELEFRNQELEEKIKTVREQANYIEKLNTELKKHYDELEFSNRLLKEKEQILVEQNAEIESSLQYAQQIQRMLLPGIHEISQIFESFFILYIPREYISGDFYWISQIGQYKLAIVGDATGHGVPGALVSILGMSIIKKLISEYHIIDPADILNKLQEDLRGFYHKYKGTEVSPSLEKEGFALSIVRINPQTQTITYSTAGQVIYLVDVQNNDLHELKDSRRDITFAFPGPIYNQHSVEYRKHDMLYLFTDGYPDQIGGKDGKKFKYHRLKSILLKTSSLPAENQKLILEETLFEWINTPQKNDMDPIFQIDDITILGIRLS